MFKKTIAVLLLSLFYVISSFAEVPKFMNYQGMLCNETGTPVSGEVSIRFGFYLTETGGEPFWSEIQNVQIEEGYFNVVLGSVTSFETSTQKMMPDSVFLEIQVGSDSPMTPRKRFVTVPYAFNAENTAKLGGQNADAFIRSINGVGPVGGEVELVAGNNVSITPLPGSTQIQISASGSGGGDDLGDHRADKNIEMRGHWLSGDGEDEGISISEAGYVTIPKSLYCKSYIATTGIIQATTTIRTGYPSSSYSTGDIASTDDLFADDDVIAGDMIESKGNMLCRGHLSVNHTGINTQFPLFVNGTAYFSGTINTGGRLISSGIAGINGPYSTAYALRVNGNCYATGAYYSSDVTLKKNIASIDNPISRLMRLKGVSYDWKREEYSDRGFSEKRQRGLIAQELEKVYPEMVMTDEHGEKAIAYYQLIPVLLEAMKQQQRQIDALQQRVDELGQ